MSLKILLIQVLKVASIFKTSFIKILRNNNKETGLVQEVLLLFVVAFLG